MYIIICKRENIKGELVAIPIMGADDEGEETGSMATFESFELATQFTEENMLCNTSENIIVDLNDGDGILV